VRLPHLQLCDLGLSEDVISKFMHQEIKVLPAAAISSEWLHTLPGYAESKIYFYAGGVQKCFLFCFLQYSSAKKKKLFLPELRYLKF
jgi:hypothetical protein